MGHGFCQSRRLRFHAPKRNLANLANLGVVERGGAFVADKFAGEFGQDRGRGRCRWLLLYFPNGRILCASQSVPWAITANTDNLMNTCSKPIHAINTDIKIGRS